MGSLSTLKNSIKYIKLVSKKSGDSFFESSKKMKEAKQMLGVRFDEYYKHGFYNMTRARQSRESNMINGNHRRKREAIANVSKQTGWSKKAVVAKLEEINGKNIFKLNYYWYNRLELYKLNDEDLEKAVWQLKRRWDLVLLLHDKFNAIDKGELSYEDVEQEYNEFLDINNSFMTDTIRADLVEWLKAAKPELVEDEKKIEEAIRDFEATRVLLGFNSTEYVMFQFVDKNLQEKRTFISEREREKVLDSINNMDVADNLDDKYTAYKLLSKYYGREIMLVESEKDYPEFCEFCKRNREFIKKPAYDSMGRGIEKVAIHGNERDVFDMLIQDEAVYLVEGFIHAHDEILKLHPASVNTVRLVTYLDGDEVKFHLPFMKVGQKGSFVDNGGAGGIFVAVDPETGRFVSDGVDEKGVRYEKQPDTGIVFTEYTLPDWEQALALGRELADKVPGFKYIGWDLTYTDEGKWIVVEGNSRTQFLGQQSTRNTGAKADLIQTVHYQGEL